MLENEDLFLRLCLMHQEGSSEKRELIESGYITSDSRLTQKGEDIIKSFIEANKNLLYEAMKDYPNDNWAAMGKAGFTEYTAFMFVAEELCDEGLLIKGEQGRYHVK